MFGIQWHRLPTPLALLNLVLFRNKLRQNNLHDTSQIPHPVPPPMPSPDNHHLAARTADGSFNDLDHPEMGMADTRLGRNVPLSAANLDQKNLLHPNPRIISQTLLARDEFRAASF